MTQLCRPLQTISVPRRPHPHLHIRRTNSAAHLRDIHPVLKLLCGLDVAIEVTCLRLSRIATTPHFTAAGQHQQEFTVPAPSTTPISSRRRGGRRALRTCVEPLELVIYIYINGTQTHSFLLPKYHKIVMIFTVYVAAVNFLTRSTVRCL